MNKGRLHHFLLTRFNLRFSLHNKHGQHIDWAPWLERRMSLFEHYCLPSVTGQTCGDFVWVLLVDANTPENIRTRLLKYQEHCPQIHFVRVRSDCGMLFVEIFSQVVAKLLAERNAAEGDLCLTTYLDNDDCLAHDFVAATQDYFAQKQNETTSDLQLPLFLSFDYGLQVFTELENFTTQINYPNNHFLTLAETIAHRNFQPKTCYGYGSHFLIEHCKMARVTHIADNRHPMWAEIIHKENIDNDVKMTFHTRVLTETSLLRQRFSLSLDVHTAHRLAFYVRALGQIWRRTKNKFRENPK